MIVSRELFRTEATGAHSTEPLVGGAPTVRACASDGGPGGESFGFVCFRILLFVMVLVWRRHSVASDPLAKVEMDKEED